MRIVCDAIECTHNKDKTCTQTAVYLVDGKCDDYKDYFKNNPLYEAPYFKRCRTCVDGKTLEYRVPSKGMRYEWKGFVLYTEDDIRETIGHANFTEETTGLLMSGETMLTSKEFPEIVRNAINREKPVLELPLMVNVKEAKKVIPNKENQ